MVGVITYGTPHMKTTDLMRGLLERGEEIGTVYGLPFVPRPEREVLFRHRPAQAIGPHPEEFARQNGIRYVAVKDATSLRIDEDVALVTIGVIIPARTLEDTSVINCHPGLIPSVRGLDAFKWAILEGKPLGNTLHYIDKEVDCGEIIYREKTPVLSTDTIEDLAARHYACEMRMNIAFRDHLPGLGEHIDNAGLPPSHRRMNRETEAKMLQAFDAYVEAFAE